MKVIILLLFILQVKAADKANTQTMESSPVPTIPGNEILLFDIAHDLTGNIQLSKGKNISNHVGYDSQPRFSNDGSVLYYTRAVETKGISQTDIYQYNVVTEETKPYMVTAESEYSPTPMIGQNGLSVVQVDASGDQYIVLLNTDGTAEKQMRRYSDLKQVGYFNWTVDNQNWSFVLNDSNGGDLYHMGKDKIPALLENNVGRTFVNDLTNQLIYYVDKSTTPWRIKSRKKKLSEVTDIMALPMAVEDFTVDSKGRFWAGRDNTLFLSNDQKRWFIVAEFNNPKLNNITRLTTDPAANKIAIVFAEKAVSQ